MTCLRVSTITLTIRWRRSTPKPRAALCRPSSACLRSAGSPNWNCRRASHRYAGWRDEARAARRLRRRASKSWRASSGRAASVCRESCGAHPAACSTKESAWARSTPRNRRAAGPCICPPSLHDHMFAAFDTTYPALLARLRPGAQQAVVRAGLAALGLARQQLLGTG